MDAIDVQVAAARRGVLAVPLADRVTIAVTGDDRVAWLNGLITCDLAKRAPGEARYGLFVARSGRVVADALVAVEGARVLASVPEAASAALVEHLQKYLVMEDAEIDPRRGAFAAWALHGPRSPEVAEAARAAGAAGGILDRTGLGGAVVFAERENAEAVRSAMAGALADGAVVFGDAAGWQALRLERAVPEFGADFGEATYPQEAALEKTAVSFDKGCYLGQEVVCMLEMRGHVKRKLVSLLIDAGAPPAAGAAVSDGAGDDCGVITSAAASPTLDRPVALAMVKRAAAASGTPVAVAGIGGRVVERPA